MELFNSIEHATKNELFSQRDIIKLCHTIYGKLAMSRKPTTDNKVCAVAIAITDEDIWQLLPDMLGKSKGGNVQSWMPLPPGAAGDSICSTEKLWTKKW